MNENFDLCWPIIINITKVQQLDFLPIFEYVMAPNKKKKKVVSNPARGFATVSIPSKTVDQIPPEVKESPEILPLDGKCVRKEKIDASSLEHGASDLQHMSPEELEKHLEEAELQSLLDSHGSRSRKDIGRQIARLETERRSLRQSGMTLETESWLHDVLEDILELARSTSSDLKASKTADECVNEMDLSVRLWNVQETLKSLHFRNIEGALKYLIQRSSVIAKTVSNPLIWGLDEAVDWLALYSDPTDLPSYQQLQPANQTFAHSSREIVENPDSTVIDSGSCSLSTDEASVGTSSPTPVSQTKNETFGEGTFAATSDESDDDEDPDHLIDRYLSAKYELLKESLSEKGHQQEQYTTDQQASRLVRRIQRIERDVLFDRDEAIERWGLVKKDLETEHARSIALEKRRNRSRESSTPADMSTTDGEAKDIDSAAYSDDPEGDLFGAHFAPNETKDADNETSSSVEIIVRDFGPIGAGASPRKVLEEFCKAK